jgi:hypothetical protein
MHLAPYDFSQSYIVVSLAGLHDSLFFDATFDGDVLADLPSLPLLHGTILAEFAKIGTTKTTDKKSVSGNTA